MPRISAFYGIVIYMHYNDHAPPHFHAKYGEFEARIVIATVELMDDEFPPRAWRLVRSWTRLHQPELLADWDLMRADSQPNSIAPLP